MRLSPPLTILAIVAAAFGVMAWVRPSDDCAFAPDGTPRDRTIGQVLKDRLIAPQDCDVWAGIVPQKKLETIELLEETQGGALLVARIDPTGSGFVAIIPPYSQLRNPLWTSHNPPVEQFRRFSAAFATVQNSPSTYSTIVDLIGPMRDFQGGNFLKASSASFDQSTEIGDHRTRKILCRKSIQISPPDLGPIITFRFHDAETPVYVSTGVNCLDVAQRSAERRVSAAIAHLIDATGQAPAIKRAANREYPFCGRTEGKEPCINPRL